MISRIFVWVVVLMMVIGSSKGAELMVQGDVFDPTKTLEVRFSTDMVSRDALGVAVKESPLVVSPELPGKWTWLSRRSGVFVPSEAPRLGTAYRLALREGLADAAGERLTQKIDRTLKTPAFEMTTVLPGASPEGSIGAQQEVRMAFDAEVKLETAKFTFIGGDGRSVPGEVRYAVKRDYFNVKPEQGDWTARWTGAKPVVVEPDDDDDDAPDPKAQAPLKDRIVVTPRGVLTPGLPWRLEMAAGLESLAGGYRIEKPRTFGLGTVLAFTLKSVATASYVNEGRSVTLAFEGRLAPDVDAGTFERFLKITPAVPELRLEADWDSTVLKGKFERGVEYTLRLDPSLLSSAGLPVSGELAHKFTFQPVVPRVYLPKFTGHQIAEGRRVFDVDSVNLSALKVTALLVESAAVADAIEAFKKYDRESGDDGAQDEPYQALAPGALKGRVIFEKKMALPDAAMDVEQRTSLDWNEILGARRTGCVLLTVEGVPMAIEGARTPAAQTLMQLTDLGVIWKVTEAGLRVNVFSMATGKALAGTKTVLLDEDRAPLANGASDAAGAVVLPVAEKMAWLRVSSGADAFTMRMGQGEELPMEGFGLRIWYNGWGGNAADAKDLEGLIFTDRPLYRPGEKVHVKGMVRRVDADGLAVEPGMAGVVRLLWPRGDRSTTVDIRTDAHGAFDATLELDSTSVGRFSMSSKMEGSRAVYSTSFQVAEFQPNAFEVAVEIPPRLAPGDAVSAAVSGKYFFGSPIAGADVKWTLQGGPTSFAREDYEGFTFISDLYNGLKTLTLRGEGKLDGSTKISPRLPEADHAPQRGTLTVEVTDVNQQTVSARRDFVRDASAFYLGLAMGDSNVLRVGEAITGTAIAVTPEGEPMEKPVKIKAALVRVVERTVRVQGAGGAVSFSSSTEEVPVETVEGATLMPERVGETWKAPKGASFTMKPVKAGSYRLSISSVDAGGHAVATERGFYVSGEAQLAWDFRNPAQVDLIADKAKYHVGETARVLVKSPFTGEATVSVERAGAIRRQWQVKLEGNAPVIEVPIEKGDAPNVFVSMMLVRGSEASTRKFKTPEYRYGVCDLKVENPDAALAVTIAPEKADVQPGEEVVSVVTVKGADGRPAVDADVTFYAVDDGVLALTGFERPDPLATFSEPFPLSIRTGISLMELLAEDPADLGFANKGYLIGGGGTEGPGLSLRTNFPGTAVWLPSLRTGADGTVTARFKAPDALTRYRLVAVVSEGAGRFGAAESAVAIKKPLMVLSALGPVAHVRDRLIARAVVRNESGADGTVKLTLKLDNTATAAEELASAFALKKGESRMVDFPVEIRAIGDGHWVWEGKLEADGQTFHDAVEAVVRVDSPAPVLREIYFTELLQPRNDLLAGVNPQLLEGTGAMTVTLSNTRLASLRSAAEELLNYPYGCAEQLVSSIAPWLTVAELEPVLPGALKNRDVQKTVQAGIEKIMTLQTKSGGLAYWPGKSEAELFPTAWAVIVLSRAERAGAAQPAGWKAMLDFLTNSLRGAANERPGMSLEDRVFAAYALALAGTPEPAYHAVLLRRRAELSHESRALLAMAMMLGGERGNVIATLLDRRAEAGESWSWFGSQSRSLAIELMAWSLYQPKDPEVSRLVAELLQARQNGSWRTTQGNAWALLALSEYFTRVEGKLMPVNATMSRAGVEIPVALTTEKLSQAWPFEFTENAPLGPLEVANPQKRNLFGETKFVVRPPVADQPRQDRGYSVTRLYQKLGADGALADADDLRVGDRVLVTLHIETQVPGHFVAIDDPLPANLEAVNPEFKTQQVGGAGGLAAAWDADFRETRTDRVVYFCDHLQAGAYTFRYLARVRSAGEVIAPATKAEEMYRPERLGLSATARLKSAPPK